MSRADELVELAILLERAAERLRQEAATCRRPRRPLNCGGQGILVVDGEVVE